MSLCFTNVTTVVLVNWNGGKDSIECLESLRASKGFEGTINVVIVDNNSSDNSIKQLEDHFYSIGMRVSDDIKNFETPARIKRVARYEAIDLAVSSLLLVEARDNYGFAAGNNLGRQEADHLWNSDYYWLLNNDTRVAPNALNMLVQKMQVEQDISICGCTILNLDDSERVQAYGGSWYSLKTGRGFSVGMNQIYDPQLKSSDVESNINYISGAAMFIKAATMNRLGGLCEDYFLYNEEIDLSMRLIQGERLGVAIKAMVYHKLGASIGTDKGDQAGSRLATFFQTRSKLIFAAKHTPYYLPLVWLTLFARSIKFCLTPTFCENGLIILLVLLGKRKSNPLWFSDRAADDSRD